MPKVSIIMAYINRKQQLYNSLTSISFSQEKNVEVVIVDDGSSDDHRVEDLVDRFPFQIKLIRIEPEQKTWINPCVPYNMGINGASGDILIIQNPECFHFYDVIRDAVQRIKYHKHYYVYSVYGINKDLTDKISEFAKQNSYDEITSLLRRKIDQHRFPEENNGCIWYNHAGFRKRPYHFLAALHKETMAQIGGFNEKFSAGFWFDDDEFLYRARKTSTLVELKPYPIGIHQYHDTQVIGPNKDELIEKNRLLYVSLCT